MAQLNVMKVVFYAFNFIDIIFAIALMAVGSYAINQQFITNIGVPIGITVVGVILLLASFFGVFAACKESAANKILLTIYVIVIAIIIVILLIIGIAVAVEKNNAAMYVFQGWQQLDNPGKTQLQYELNCCGGYYYNDTAAGVPCPNPDLVPISRRPCVDVIAAGFLSAFSTAGGCGIAFAVIMLIGLLISVFLLRKARLGYNESQYKQHDGTNSIQTDAASI